MYLMSHHPAITDIILDFDGTCTQIPQVYEGFERSYFAGFAAQLEQRQQHVTEAEWREALALVRQYSPTAGWTVATCPSAPAAADPYILCYEAACLILRRKHLDIQPDATIFPNAYSEYPAPWRTDAAATFRALQEKGIRLHFISNSSTAGIQKRLESLPGFEHIGVEGGASKYKICEPSWEPGGAMAAVPATMSALFRAVPVALESALLGDLGRPAYLRRGAYFEAICRTLDNDPDRLATTVFCGDVWELDLALPAALGACVHLMKREAPFDTYGYEEHILALYGQRAKCGDQLSDLLQWVS